MKNRYKILIIAFAFLILIGGAFTIYVSDYYPVVIDNDTMPQTSSYETEGNLTLFSAGTPGNTGLIFYPGGKVDEKAYFPLMKKLSQSGITCVLVKMPFHLAVLDASAADQVYDKLPEIEHWYIGGHSLGGSMASSYAASNQDKIEGLILLGAYIYGDVSPNQALTIYGSNDLVLDRSKITYTENIVVIEGGDHAYFGNYGEQDGDGTASITRDEQQKQTVDAVISFIL